MVKLTRRTLLRGVAAVGGTKLASNAIGKGSLSALERWANSSLTPPVYSNSVAEAAAPQYKLPNVIQVPDEGYKDFDPLAAKAKLVWQYVTAKRKPKHGEFKKYEDSKGYDARTREIKEIPIGTQLVFVINGIRYTVFAGNSEFLNKERPHSLAISAQVEGKGVEYLAHLADDGVDGRVNTIIMSKKHIQNPFGEDFDYRSPQRINRIVSPKARQIFGNMLDQILAAYR